VLQPLVAIHRGGDTVVVRFRMPAARAVAIAGNWNAWTPARFARPGPGRLGSGAAPRARHLLLQPGRRWQEWVVPAGVATIPDGMGGLIAVLNVL